MANSASFRPSIANVSNHVSQKCGKKTTMGGLFLQRSHGHVAIAVQQNEGLACVASDSLTNRGGCGMYLTDYT